MWEKLSGSKTYIMMFITAGMGIAMHFGVSIPEWLWAIDAALFGGALRAGMPPKEKKK